MTLPDFGFELEEVTLPADVWGETKTERYLKYRVFPTAEATGRLELSERTDTFDDTFYDNISDGSLLQSTKQGSYFRRRVAASGQPIFVKQTTTTSPRRGNSHSYIQSVSSEAECTAEAREAFLCYSFTRKYSELDDNVYLDTITKPVEYSVISIRRRIDEESSVGDIAVGILRIAWQLENGRCSPLPEPVKDLLDSASCRFFPVYSKFMFLLQMSGYHDVYYKVCDKFDPVSECLQARLELVASTDEHPCYSKEYIWSVSYQIVYFLGIYQNRKYNRNADLTPIFDKIKLHKDEIYASNSFVSEDCEVF